jgi:pilus assembly protein CpaF
MFSVIISEKGGSERRETFDRSEINVGRVQGNDLMLPKGNVSKRHARLLCRDGRFIVTDLKSTNGTYVNGRKIAQATIVREGDKIYIGDFVLRVEAGAGAFSSQAPPPIVALADDAPSDVQAGPPPHDAALAPRVELPSAPVLHQQVPAIPPPPVVHEASSDHGLDGGNGPRPKADSGSDAGTVQPPSPAAVSEPPSSQPSSGAERNLKPQGPRIEPSLAKDDRHEVISHFPLEHDPDESVHFAVPAPPRMPTGARVGRSIPAASQTPLPRSVTGVGPQSPGPTAPPTPFALPAPPPPDRTTSPSVGLSALGIQPAGRRSGEPIAPMAPMAPISPMRPRLSSNPDVMRAAAHRAALANLVARVEERVDLRALDSGAKPDEALVAQIDHALDEAASGSRENSEVDAGALVGDARRELVELGPLGMLLDDDDVGEIRVSHHDHVVALHGGRQVRLEVAFTSEHALGRAIRRLCLAAGEPLGDHDPFPVRRLPSGARVLAVVPRGGKERGYAVVIRKPQRADASLDDLVRSGAISRAIASVLAQCVSARANILVAAAAGGGAPLLGALAGAGIDDGLVLLHEGDEILLNHPHTTAIALGETDAERGQATKSAARLRPERLVVPSFTGEVAAELVDAMSEGMDGVIAASRGPSLRQAVARLSADLAARRPGLSHELARNWLASVFDVAIEVARLRDGRLRVLRVADLASGSDIFTFTVERTAAGGAIEGSFAPTGHVPRILEDLAARGVAVDTSVFRRHTRADHAPSPSGATPEADAAQPSPRGGHGEPPKSPARP